MSYPIGRSTDEANLAKNRLERAQAAERVKSAEARVVQQVRNVAWRIDMNAKRIGVARRRAGGWPTNGSIPSASDSTSGCRRASWSFRRSAISRRPNRPELAAVLGYDLALVEFEAIQRAAPDNRQ